MDLAESLTQCGAAVIGPAAALGEALMLADRKERPDCAVLDLNLNGEMVFPLADALAERGVPFVFLTGYREDFIPARYANVPRYEKPFNYAAVSPVPAAR
jgi:CheY-like chemotaxis protein